MLRNFSVVFPTAILLSSFFYSELAQGQALPWKRFAIDSQLNGADGVRLADANGDGLVDIVSGWEESGATRAYFNPGSAKCRQSWPYVQVGTSPSIEDAVWVDLNNDNHLDILSSCEGSEQSLRYFLAPSNRDQLLVPELWQSGIVSSSQHASRWMFAAPFDDNTVVIGSKNPNGMVALLQIENGDVENASIQKLATAGWIMSLYVLDVDRDGDSDILYSDRRSSDSGIYWLQNSDDGNKWDRFSIGQQGTEVMFLSRPQVTEESSSTRLQLTAAIKADKIVSLRQQADPKLPWEQTFATTIPNAMFGNAKGVAVANLDEHGAAEIVFSCESANEEKCGVGYIKIDEHNNVTYHKVSGPAGIKFDLVELVDLDSDGDLDILTCEEREKNNTQGGGLGVIWYENPTR